MPVPKTKKDPIEEQDPKKQPPADPAGDPPKEEPPADPAGDPPAADPAADPADPADTPVADPPATVPTDPADPPAADPAPDSEEVATLKQQLLEANSRNAAYKAGVKAVAVDDAVVLAMHAVKLSGEEPSEEAVGKAIASVLERHPEWNAASTPSAPAKAGAEPPADHNKTNAILHGKVVL